MVVIPVRCPHCDTDQIVKRGKTETGKQRQDITNVSIAAKPKTVSVHSKFVMTYLWQTL